MKKDENEIQAKIEAALYAAGRPLSIKELCSASGINSKRKNITITRSLAKIINSSLMAIEIVESSDQKFSLQLKGRYERIARRFSTRPLISHSILKTLSHIVYLQPISGTELVLRRGTHVYKHLKYLEDLGFISRKKSGRTRIYKTTSNFSDYFGLSGDFNIMKKQLTKELKKRNP
jgi:segregation and condensation protein B